MPQQVLLSNFNKKSLDQQGNMLMLQLANLDGLDPFWLSFIELSLFYFGIILVTFFSHNLEWPNKYP
jgi:hypothetical protein